MAVVEDSWGRLFRDVLVRVASVGLVVGGTAWCLGYPVGDWARLVAGYALRPGAQPPVARSHGRAHPAPRREPEAAEPTTVVAEPTAEVPGPSAVKAADQAPVPPVEPPPAPPARPVPAAPVKRAVSHGGVAHVSRTVAGVPLEVVTIDLHDPAVVGTLVLAKDAPHPNSAEQTVGDEAFAAMAGRAHAAVAINGTFFSKDDQKRVMGNMVRQGALIKFSQWDHDGTTFWLGPNNDPGMCTPKAEGPPPWDKAWLALSCGPRLVKDGRPWLQPATEGFRDAHVLGAAGRSALGFDAQRLLLVSFNAGVTLAQEANVMKALGCRQAMNLDGGASRSLAVGGRLVVPAGRPLTNVLAFYDAKHPAPSALIGAFRKFGP